jgi:hypothetical protein
VRLRRSTTTREVDSPSLILINFDISALTPSLHSAETTLDDGPRAPTAIHGTSGLKFHPFEKANAITDCFENQFAHHDLCDENHERRVEARVQTLLEAVNKPPERIRPCDLQKLINSLKLIKSCGIDGIPNECLRQLPR